MLSSIPENFSEEKCPPDQVINVKKRNEVKDELDLFFKVQDIKYNFHTLNSENLFFVTSFSPLHYIKVVCTDRPVFPFSWVKLQKEKKKEGKEQTSILSSWFFDKNHKNYKKTRSILTWIIIYLLIVLILYL
jgi:hypothetical protein